MVSLCGDAPGISYERSDCVCSLSDTGGFGSGSGDETSVTDRFLPDLNPNLTQLQPVMNAQISDSKTTSLKSTPNYHWDRPLPPPPEHILRLTQSKKKMHNHYCDYYHLLKKGMNQHIPVSSHCKSGSTLVQVMTWRLTGAKPLPDPVLTCGEFNHWELGFNKIWWLCLVPTSTTHRFACGVGYRMAKKLIGLYKEIIP